MTFTEEDAENDGKVKREVGQQLNSVLARESGELYTEFRQWCQDNGLDPSVELGTMALNAMRDEGYAEDVSSTVVDMAQLRKSEIRREDLELVVDLMDKFADEEEDNDDFIEEVVRDRIKSVGSGPLGGMGQGIGGPQTNGDGADVQRIEQKIDQLEQQLEQARSDEGASQNDSVGVDEPSPDRSVDDLFGESSSGGDAEPDSDDGGVDGDGVTGDGDVDSDSGEEEEDIEVVDKGHNDEEDIDVSSDNMEAIPTSTDEAEQ